nr:hypothetical protein [Pectobacterium polaris]
MAIIITQDRQLASPSVTEDEKEYVVSVKSKAGGASTTVFVMAAKVKAGFIVTGSHKSKSS